MKLITHIHLFALTSNKSVFVIKVQRIAIIAYRGRSVHIMEHLGHNEHRVFVFAHSDNLPSPFWCIQRHKVAHSDPSSCRVSAKVGNNCQWQLIRIGDLAKVKWKNKRKGTNKTHVHAHAAQGAAHTVMYKSSYAHTHTHTHTHTCTYMHTELQCQDERLKSSWPCVHKISHRAKRPVLQQCIVTEKNSNWGSLFKLREGKGWRLSFSPLVLLSFFFLTGAVN